MKKISIYGLAALTLGAVLTQSCSDNWEEPAMSVPTFPEGTEANITIAELKAKYWQDQDAYGTTIGTAEDGSHYTIIGTVTSSCTAGNIYKSLYVQDATGAICIGVDTSAVSSAFPQGPAMAIDVTGLCIGRFNGAMQMGTLVGTGVNRITMPELRPHVNIDFFKGKLDTLTVDIPTINEAIRSSDGIIKYGGRLIRIDGVHFTEAGQPFAANGNTTSRTLVDEDGNRIIIYNSSYADFANKLLPTGTGSVVGILSNYRTSWQILLNDIDGLIGFDPIEDGSTVPPVTVEPKGDGTAANPYNVAKAIEIVTSGAATTDEVYVTGTIDQITEVDTGSYGNATYSINDGEGTTSMLVYRGYWLNGAKFTSADQIEAGKEVVVLGKLVSFSGNAQIAQGNKIMQYDGQGTLPEEPSTPGTPEGDGTAANPYNTTAALDVAKALADGDKVAAYAKGKIASITEIDTGNYGNATYAITDGSATLQVYRGYGLNGAKFTSADEIKVGDEVVISGDLVNYKGNTPQFTQGSRIISINGQGGGDTPDTPDTPIVDDNKGNFNSFNDGQPKSSYGTYTNATGWTAENCNILAGYDGEGDGTNPNFAFIGSPSTLAVTLNGKAGSAGKITSPTLTGGCGKLTFNYGFAYNETTETKFTVTIKQGGNVVKTQTVTVATADWEKFKVYDFSMDVNVTGDFSIEIVNDCAGESTANKERVSIWNLTWTE